ncbi:MAG TPA: energy-coupling factor transporter transmembrane component T [Baekduia sp.]|uniref:energy-coupling factor transporter transmembrane component T n=1 Tax=Baekduia sp. TaxID=2600305 RepID=UPI002D7A2E9B|nr:energy-coupling factor transporter transmembrane component T [Baekduia sp.]HET6506017.1 energy-coupling factor transporter transmembrane component T [Baekduia sp.]
MRYRRRASPLHAARAAAGGAWCAAVAAAALSAEHPLVLAALALVVLAGAAGAGVGREVGKIVAWMVPWALVIAFVNMLVVRDGLTVLARLGEVPPFGQVDLTLEALVYGGQFGARLLLVAAAFAIFTVAVDPDDLLRLMRRASVRSALAATLAVRLVPVLAADAARIDEARRCRADGGGDGTAARLAVLRAVAGGALDRALDVAATLEVRGYGSARRRSGGSGVPWSRHDLAFLGSAVVLVALTVASRVAGFASFGTYPELHSSGVVEAVVLGIAYISVALLPLADRRGIVR